MVFSVLAPRGADTLYFSIIPDQGSAWADCIVSNQEYTSFPGDIDTLHCIFCASNLSGKNDVLPLDKLVHTHIHVEHRWLGQRRVERLDVRVARGEEQPGQGVEKDGRVALIDDGWQKVVVRSEMTYQLLN